MSGLILTPFSVLPSTPPMAWSTTDHTPFAGTNLSMSNGNLTVKTADSAGQWNANRWGMFRGSKSISAGKRVYEVVLDSSAYSGSGGAGNCVIVGIATAALSTALGQFPGRTAADYGYWGENTGGWKWNNGSFSAYGAIFGVGDVITIVADYTANQLSFLKNGVSQGNAFSSISGNVPAFPCIGIQNDVQVTARFAAAAIQHMPSGGTSWDGA